MNGFQYIALRCVPRVEREEFINVGVVLYCQEEKFLRSASQVDPARLKALDPNVDVDAVLSALNAIEAVCRGDEHAGLGLGIRMTSTGGRELADTLSTRFGFIKAARSTVVQPGPVHGGLTDDPETELAKLLAKLVGQTGTSSTAPTA
ncbi:MAG: hypothetical protein JWR35_1064 [Marmoricola sp.]|jgi:hypothetical protein|nr:hypothetical protein [Marmoricola sp.]